MWVRGVGCSYKHEHCKNGIKRLPKTLPMHTTHLNRHSSPSDRPNRAPVNRSRCKKISHHNAHSGLPDGVRYTYIAVRALWDLVGATRSPTVWSQCQKEPAQPVVTDISG